MKWLKITETHGWTVRDLRKQERKVKDIALRQRIMAVCLVMEGYLGKEVAAMLNLHHQSIATCISNFNAGGLDAVLERKFSPGKEPYLSEQQREKLKQLIVESTPADQGISMYTSWDTRIIQKLLQEKYGISMSRGGITGMLRRMGLSYTLPTYTLAKADKKKQEAFVSQMNLIKKLLTDDMVLLYEDESHIRDYQALRATWAEVGKQKKIPTYGHHASATLFGVVNALDGDVFCTQAEQCNAETFRSFLKNVLERYANKTVVMVLDNARIHRAKLIQPLLEENRNRLFFIFYRLILQI